MIQKLFNFAGMHIHIHHHDDEVKRLILEVICKLNKLLEDGGNDEQVMQEIMDKLNSAIADIKSTIKN